MTGPTLLAVPNVSEGGDRRVLEAIGAGFAGRVDRSREQLRAGPDTQAPPTRPRARATHAVRLLDVHSDADHGRSVFTLAGYRGELADALMRGAAEAVARIDVMSGGRPRAQHPHVGALDVAPIVYLDAADRGAACAEALVVADRIGSELGVPVFLYGELAGGAPGSSRAARRSGGVVGLARRMAQAGDGVEAGPDFGPARMHASAGASLVGAREPLVAFNVLLSPPADLADARAIAALIREGGAEGLAGVRAIGMWLSAGVAQVSTNVEHPLQTPLACVVAAVAGHARVSGAEIVGLAPRAALDGFPPEVSLGRFDASRQLIENALRS